MTCVKNFYLRSYITGVYSSGYSKQFILIMIDGFNVRSAYVKVLKLISAACLVTFVSCYQFKQNDFNEDFILLCPH